MPAKIPSPSNLTLKPAWDNVVQLTWTEATGVKQYAVERSDDDGKTWQTLKLATGNTTKADGKPKSLYRVRSVGSTISEPSNTVGLAVIIAKPSPVQPATPDFTGKVPFSVPVDCSDIAGFTPEAFPNKLVTWTFGDDAGQFNTLPGGNANHVYDAVGDFTITRTIVDDVPGATPLMKTWLVRTTVDDRTPMYVRSDGINTGTGETQETAISYARLATLLPGRSNVKVMLRRGDTFVANATLVANGTDVWLTSYGMGAQPKLTREYSLGDFNFIEVRGLRVAVDGFTFDVLNPPFAIQTRMPHAISLGGRNAIIRGNTFRNVGYAVNGNAGLRGAISIGNTSPLNTGVRAYTFWGNNAIGYTIVGNTVQNSTQEHCCRQTDSTYINVSYNHFTQLGYIAANDPENTGIDQVTGVARDDYFKGTITHQYGNRASGTAKAFFSVYGNTLIGGDYGIGPLGSDGQIINRTPGVVCRDNHVIGATIKTYHGAEHVAIVNNVIDADNSVGNINVQGYSSTYNRTSDDIRIEHNTLIDDATTGTLIRIGSGATNVRILNNLTRAPALVISPSSSHVQIDSATSVALSSGNRYGTPAGYTGGANSVRRVNGDKESLAAMLIAAPLDAIVSVPLDAIAYDGAGSSLTV